MARCFNCTTMELKSPSICPMLGHWSVLIVPSWNWNYDSFNFDDLAVYCFNCTIMEFKYKRTKLKDNKAMQCFNCTIMELKGPISERINNGVRVLIVPYWNWNSRHTEGEGAIKRFNCTSVELKYVMTLRQSKIKSLF